MDSFSNDLRSIDAVLVTQIEFVTPYAAGPSAMDVSLVTWGFAGRKRASSDEEYQL